MTIAMKKMMRNMLAIACAAFGLSSCVMYEYPVHTSGSVGVSSSGVAASVAWSDARYDVNGFPIFGYSYGQPVYGYTSGGVAVFSFYALTSSCCVPSWGPAHWYCGHWHYPKHVHRVSIPPRHPAWHHPGRRLARPAYRPAPAAPHRPAVHHHSGKPGGSGGRLQPSRPAHVGGMHRPAQHGKPQIQKPQGAAPHGRPQMQKPQGAAHRPQMNQVRPQNTPGRRPVGSFRREQQRSDLQGNRVSRPTMQPQVNRAARQVAAPSRPHAVRHSAPSMPRSGGHHPAPGGHRGGPSGPHRR